MFVFKAHKTEAYTIGSFRLSPSAIQGFFMLLSPKKEVYSSAALPTECSTKMNSSIVPKPNSILNAGCQVNTSQLPDTSAKTKK